MPPQPSNLPPDGSETLLSDPAELESTLARFRPRLERMLVMRIDHRLARRIDVEDIVQEAFLEVSRRIDEYVDRRPMPFFLWVRLITGQKLIDAHRHHLGTLKRDAGRDHSVRAFPAASTITMAHALVDPASSPSSALQKVEVREKLSAALDALDEEDREVLALLYFEKLTNDEAAQALGLSYSGVRKRHVRALSRLRKELGELSGLLEVIRGADR